MNSETFRLASSIDWSGPVPFSESLWVNRFGPKGSQIHPQLPGFVPFGGQFDPLWVQIWSSRNRSTLGQFDILISCFNLGQIHFFKFVKFASILGKSSLNWLWANEDNLLNKTQFVRLAQISFIFARRDPVLDLSHLRVNLS